MFALLTFAVVAPLVIGVWLLGWTLSWIGRALGPKPARVPNLREHRAVSELRRSVEEYNEARVAEVVRRRGEPVFIGEYRIRVLAAERRLDASKVKLARALDGYRATCVDCGYDVREIPALLTADEAQDAALLIEAEREVDLLLAS